MEIVKHISSYSKRIRFSGTDSAEL